MWNAWRWPKILHKIAQNNRESTIVHGCRYRLCTFCHENLQYLFEHLFLITPERREMKFDQVFRPFSDISQPRHFRNVEQVAFYCKTSGKFYSRHYTVDVGYLTEHLRLQYSALNKHRFVKYFLPSFRVFILHIEKNNFQYYIQILRKMQRNVFVKHWAKPSWYEKDNRS